LHAAIKALADSGIRAVFAYGALGAIEVGITTILDWSHIQNSPDHTDHNVGDRVAAADMDGDGRADLARHRPDLRDPVRRI
jgi:hypothetical protein